MVLRLLCHLGGWFCSSPLVICREEVGMRCRGKRHGTQFSRKELQRKALSCGPRSAASKPRYLLRLSSVGSGLAVAWFFLGQYELCFRPGFCSFQETVIWLYKPEGGEKVERRSKTEPWAVPVLNSPSQTAACRLPQVGVKKPWLTVGLQVWVSIDPSF